MHGLLRSPAGVESGMVCGPPGSPVPQNRGLTLIGDAYRDNIAVLDASFSNGRADGRLGAFPNFQRDVFYPVGLKVDLTMFLLRDAD